MRKFLLSLSIVAVFIGLSPASARADVFDFSFSGASDSGAGTIIATQIGTSDEYIITAISGTVNGISISALLPQDSYPSPGASSPLTNDNELFYSADSSTTSYLDINGLSFELADGSLINLYYGIFTSSIPKGYNLLTGTGTYVDDPLDSFVLTAESVEPASLLLLGTGALGGFLLWRRRHSVKQI